MDSDQYYKRNTEVSQKGLKNCTEHYKTTLDLFCIDH